jgi:Tfp pilus assembly protein PilF
LVSLGVLALAIVWRMLPRSSTAPSHAVRNVPQAAQAAADDSRTALPVPTAAASATSASDGSAQRVKALIEQAHAFEQQGKPRQAMELYEQAVVIDPNAPEVLSRLAFNHLNRGQNQQASDYAARAVAVDPTSSEGWIVLGAARHALGDVRGARDAYRKCVEVGQGSYVEECRRVAR